MKKNLTTNNAWIMFIALFVLSIITILFITEFRYLKDIMIDYEGTIRQVAVNKTNLFLGDLQTSAESASRKLSAQNKNKDAALKEVFSIDHRITGAAILDTGGQVVSQATDGYSDYPPLSGKAWEEKPKQGTSILGNHQGNGTQLVVTVVTPFGKEWLALDYSITDFQQQLTQEFIGNTYRVAVFDNHNHAVVWPFEHTLLNKFTGQEEKFFANQLQYNVSSLDVRETPWKLYFFMRDNNFDTYRIITIMFLLFALYCCLYQFIVELWGVNSANSYFENIDFTIFNYINEGVIISNNAGRVIFANKSAHEIFATKRGPLKGLKIKDFLGHIGDTRDEQNKYGTLTLKTADHLLQAIHSPIIKKGKVLGALTVVGENSNEEGTCGHALSRLMEVLPQGVVFVDRNHKVLQANLMARYYLGSLDTGMSIDAVDPELAGFIYRNMGSRSFKRVQLTSLNLIGEVVFVYDDDGVYAGTLVMLNDPEGTGPDYTSPHDFL